MTNSPSLSRERSDELAAARLSSRAIFWRKFERQFKCRDESKVNADAENRRLLAQNAGFLGICRMPKGKVRTR